MPLTALEIYKHLPKKNCGECGVPTCLAFAMQLAALKTQLEKCPYVSETAKETLSAAAAPPIKLVRIGAGDNAIELGDETVMFRHDKKFNHPTGIGAIISDTMTLDAIDNNVEAANKLTFERIGMTIKLDLLALRADTGDPTKFTELVNRVRSKSQLPLILMSEKPEVIESALKTCQDARPLLHGATDTNWEAMTELAKTYKCPLVVYAPDLETIGTLTEKIKTAGVTDLVLDFGRKPLSEILKNLTIIRRLAIKKTYRPLGYPVIVFMEDGLSPEEEALHGAIYILKYASAIVFSDISPWKIYPLLTLRQNIFTDPQKPVQVKPGIYEVGQPTRDSPLMFTTNFSLTYFTVQGDVEKSKIPTYIMVVDTEGLSVMTAFAADKLTPELVANNLATTKIEEKLSHKKIIIPGMVARMSGKLNDLSGWDVIVGPRDSSAIPKFMKDHWSR
jgi:acetyl-CoA decarbonylase/synthase complex subunit gamma